MKMGLGIWHHSNKEAGHDCESFGNCSPTSPSVCSAIQVRACRTSCSLIGLMNDAIMLIRIYDEDARSEQVEQDVAAMETRSNQTPYNALNYVWLERLMDLGPPRVVLLSQWASCQVRERQIRRGGRRRTATRRDDSSGCGRRRRVSPARMFPACSKG
jgi:hypothetical protein